MNCTYAFACKKIVSHAFLSVCCHEGQQTLCTVAIKGYSWECSALQCHVIPSFGITLPDNHREKVAVLSRLDQAAM